MCCFAFMKLIKKSIFVPYFGLYEFLCSPTLSPRLPPCIEAIAIHMAIGPDSLYDFGYDKTI